MVRDGGWNIWRISSTDSMVDIASQSKESHLNLRTACFASNKVNALVRPSNALHPDPLLQALLAVEPSKATLLRATMGQSRLIVHTHAVNMHGTSLNLSGDAEPTLQILREDRRCETIFGVVGDGNGFLIGVESQKRDGWAEGLLVVEIHVGLDAFEDHRSHGRGEVAFVAGFAVDCW